jgi:hypothetical protein
MDAQVAARMVRKPVRPYCFTSGVSTYIPKSGYIHIRYMCLAGVARPDPREHCTLHTAHCTLPVAVSLLFTTRSLCCQSCHLLGRHVRFGSLPTGGCRVAPVLLVDSVCGTTHIPTPPEFRVPRRTTSDFDYHQPVHRPCVRQTAVTDTDTRSLPWRRQHRHCSFKPNNHPPMDTRNNTLVVACSKEGRFMWSNDNG